MTCEDPFKCNLKWNFWNFWYSPGYNFGCLTKNKFRHLKPGGNQCVLINLSNLRALLTWPLIASMTENPQSKKQRVYTTILWNSPKLCFPFEHLHCQTHQPKKCSWLCNQKRQQREGLSEAGRHMHFLRTCNQGPRDAPGTFSKTHKVPHPARTCQLSNQGELLSSKRYKSACSLTYHQ